MGRFLQRSAVFISLFTIFFAIAEWNGWVNQILGIDDLERYTKFIVSSTLEREKNDSERQWVMDNTYNMVSFIKRRISQKVLPDTPVRIVDRLAYDNLPVMNLPSGGKSTVIPYNAPVFFIYKFPPEATNDDVIQVTSLDQLNSWIERKKNWIHFIVIDVILALLAIIVTIFTSIKVKGKNEK